MDRPQPVPLLQPAAAGSRPKFSAMVGGPPAYDPFGTHGARAGCGSEAHPNVVAKRGTRYPSARTGRELPRICLGTRRPP
jgi:hypothetical protein